MHHSTSCLHAPTAQLGPIPDSSPKLWAVTLGQLVKHDVMLRCFATLSDVNLETNNSVSSDNGQIKRVVSLYLPMLQTTMARNSLYPRQLDPQSRLQCINCTAVVQFKALCWFALLSSDENLPLCFASNDENVLSVLQYS